jgi:hypothetical protein
LFRQRGQDSSAIECGSRRLHCHLSRTCRRRLYVALLPEAWKFWSVKSGPCPHALTSHRGSDMSLVHSPSNKDCLWKQRHDSTVVRHSLVELIKFLQI